eukprot:TRINITY_DN3016_c0_g1_i1.p1 TRINITY_DN3016_c0_g1~~TRINITY_DN3016_c0_g1_i1.p1  ORF type:complete len:1544 (+),score=470.99 TRINITY_DN3016_c0_g1_i1:17-4648(+)
MADNKEDGDLKKVSEGWVQIQRKAFSRWVDLYLKRRGKRCLVIEDDLNDGLNLIELMEILADQKLGRRNKKPKIRIQKIQNCQLAIDFIKQSGVRLENMSGEDIVDKNLKLILGLIWTIIQKFVIADISIEEMTAKEALLLWCKRKTESYDNVDVKNFTSSWKDGLAFCALIHKHRPDLIPNYNDLVATDAAKNLELAFSVAEEKLGIARFLDVEDMEYPDERSMITYLLQYYHYFAASAKTEAAARRVGKLIALTKTIDELKADYEKAAKALLSWIKDKTEEFGKDPEFDNSLEDAQAKLDEFGKYKTEEKPPKAAEKIDLEAAYSTLALKLKNNKRPAFEPDAGLSVADVNTAWEELGNAENDRLQKLSDELARQQKILGLLERFRRKANGLEAWSKEKEEYLNDREEVDTVSAAKMYLSVLEGYEESYKASQPRVESLKELGKAIIDLGAAQQEEIEATSAKVEELWEKLVGLSAAKKEWLESELEKQLKMEALRKQFANEANDFTRWTNDTIQTINVHHFGDSLEAVTAYKEELEKSDAAITKDCDERKATVDKTWGDLQDMGVTDNRYTPLTDTDMQKNADDIQDALKKRREAYEASLANQQSIENQMKGQAQVYSDFLEWLKQQREKIDGFEGEPDELSTSISEFHNDGAAGAEKLKELASVDGNVKSLGRENKHTTLTLGSLQTKNQQHNNYVTNYLADLAEEKTTKAAFDTRANALAAWADQTAEAHGTLEFDNTLAGVRSVAAEFLKYKNATKAAKNAEKAALESQSDVIKKRLSESPHTRPDFAPAVTVEQLNEKWAALDEAEAARQEKINTELKRQEKLAKLVLQFNSDAVALKNWASEKQDYLSADDDTSTLSAVKVHQTVFDGIAKEIEASKPRVAAFKELGGQITGDNYKGSDEINESIAEIEGIWAKLAEAVDAKKAALASANEAETKKEDLRLEYARLAGAYNVWVRDTVDELADHHFGTTLDTVTAFAEKLDASDAEIKAANDEKKEEISGISSQLSDAGVEDNVHTALSDEDVASLHQKVVDGTTSRRTDYDAELKRQEDMEAKRKEFAGAADEFVSNLDSQKAEIAKVEGEPDERSAAVTALYSEGSPAKEAFDKVEAVDSEAKAMGITDNPHTEYTLSVLNSKLNQFHNYVSNLLASIKRDKELKERSDAQEKELQQKEEHENMRVEYAREAQKLSNWLENANDEITSADSASSVAEAEDLIKTYGEFVATKDGAEKLVAALTDLNEKLVAESINATPALADLKSRFDKAVEQLDARKGVLDAELARQKENETLCQNFADAAEKLEQWMSAFNTSLAELSGEPEEQLKQLQTKKAEAFGEDSEGKKLLAAAVAANTAAEEAHITKNTLTKTTLAQLQTQWERLAEAVQKKQKVLEGEVAIKQGSKISAEQMEEFRESFDFFDKEKNGSLDELQFSGVLQSVGVDVEGEKLKEIYGEVDKDGKGINFEEFTEFMTGHLKDQDSEDQIVASFKEIAKDKDHITEADLRTVMPEEEVAYLLAQMPPKEGVEGGYDYEAWAKSAFSK